MGQFLESICQALGLEGLSIHWESESFEHYEAKLSFRSISEHDCETPASLQAVLAANKAKITLYAYHEEEEPLKPFEDSDWRRKFLAKLKEANEDGDEVELSLGVDIWKNNESNLIYFFEVQQFIKLFKEANLLHTLRFISGILKGYGRLRFVVPEYFPGFSTETISTSEDLDVSSVDRKRLIELCKHECTFFNLNDVDLIPNDFYFITASCSTELNNLFNQVGIIFTCGFLFDNVKFNEALEVEYSLRGVKTCEGKSKPSSLTFAEYKGIFKWVYTDSKISEKIGLARNQISMGLKNSSNPFLLETGTLKAIKSNFRIYLKENVRTYVETRNKLNEFVLENSSKASKVAEDFISSFKSSTLGFVSFFTSVIVIRLLKGEDLTSVFDGSMQVVSWAILGVSFIFAFVSCWEFKRKLERFKSSYKRFRNSYVSLLDPEDLRDVFFDDKPFNEDCAFVQSQAKTFGILWFGSILVFAALVLFLS